MLYIWSKFNCKQCLCEWDMEKNILQLEYKLPLSLVCNLWPHDPVQVAMLHSDPSLAATWFELLRWDPFSGYFTIDRWHLTLACDLWLHELCCTYDPSLVLIGVWANEIWLTQRVCNKSLTYRQTQRRRKQHKVYSYAADIKLYLSWLLVLKEMVGDLKTGFVVSDWWIGCLSPVSHDYYWHAVCN